MNVRRIEGWEGRLADYIAVARSRVFKYGEFDCCLMLCDAVEVITGVDPAAALRGHYATERGAIRTLRRYAGGGITETAEKIAATLGAPEVALSFARRGDIVLFDDRETVPSGFDAMLGVCLGREVGVIQLEGLRLLPISRAARSWAVG